MMTVGSERQQLQPDTAKKTYVMTYARPVRPWNAARFTDMLRQTLERPLAVPPCPKGCVCYNEKFDLKHTCPIGKSGDPDDHVAAAECTRGILFFMRSMNTAGQECIGPGETVM